jgi:hypothetical protein
MRYPSRRPIVEKGRPHVSRGLPKWVLSEMHKGRRDMLKLRHHQLSDQAFLLLVKK